MNSFIAFFIKQAKLMNLAVIILCLFGIYQYFNGQKEAFPTFTMNQVFITIMYPGASARTVENLVTFPVEKEIKDISGIEKLESTSKENFSSIIATVSADYENRIRDVRNDISDKIDKLNLPDDAEILSVMTIDEGLIPVIQVLAAGGENEWELRKIVDNFENDARLIPGVGGVTVLGYRDEEVKVEADPVRMEELGITMTDLINAIKLRNINLPGGKIYFQNKEFLIRVQGVFYTPDEIRKIIVRANDDLNTVCVEDVARVYAGFRDADKYYRANGKQGINIQIKKNRQGDNIKISDAVHPLCKQYEKRYPGASFLVINDTAVFVKNRLSVLTSNAFYGLIFVVIILFLFFDAATSFWTVMGMPVAFSAALVLSRFMGITLNMMSMFGFIIVVGMIVDDAIVVAENIYQKMEQGMEP
ncbi:MAG TPA: hypothetical protein DC049_12200, partial [Spirochaetia bacterium]|nr:hypothetical protein [Spirochaetia bacterium]